MTPVRSPIEDLHERMETAARDLDFEEAKRLRDQINLMRAGANADDAQSADTSGLTRQKPGAMGLGSSQSKPERPADWIKPAKPDPMTKGRNRRR